MRSFYASCAAALEGLDVMRDAIAVVGNLEQRGSIVLAASPPMKKRFNVKTGTRLYEIPKHPDIFLIEPKMATYLEVSMEIPKLLNQYVPMEAIHVYSVDECFFDLSGTEQLWGPIARTVERIQYDLYRQFQLPSAVGVGPNMLMSKLALDLEAKKSSYARWTYADVATKLWPIRPLSEMWGIGRRTEKTLNDMGIFSIGDLANSDLSKLEKKFGIMGNQYYYHAWGIDLSEMGAPLLNGQISYGKSQVLMKDYNSRKSVLTVILEMCEDVAMRTRLAKKVGRTIHLGIGYSKHALGGGFSRSKSLKMATNDALTIYQVCLALFDKFYDHRPVRNISLSITNLESETSMQLDLFEQDKWEKRKLAVAMDAIRNKYGSTAILRGVSLTKDGTAIKRSQLVGGHKG
ncbi:Y-family DNA polymerase [Sporosarcina sp. CAU 1771]